MTVLVNATDGTCPQLISCHLSVKDCYNGLLNSYSGFEEKLANEGNLYLIHYAKEAMKIQIRCYFQEAKWLKAKHTPTMDEYIPGALNTSFSPVAITSFLGVGNILTKDTMDWFVNDRKIMKATSLIGRLLNDLAAYKFEQSGEHSISAMKCYMNQYGVTDEDAKAKLTQQVIDAWKDLNEELLNLHSSNIIPITLLRLLLNLARSGDFFYKNGDDAYTRPDSMPKAYVVYLYRTRAFVNLI